MLSRYRVEFQKVSLYNLQMQQMGKRPYHYLLINSIYNDARRYAKDALNEIYWLE